MQLPHHAGRGIACLSADALSCSARDGGRRGIHACHKPQAKAAKDAVRHDQHGGDTHPEAPRCGHRRRLVIWTLGLYFFRRYMITSLWFFLGVVSITYLIDFTETSGRFDSLPGYSVSGVLYLTALRLPLILQQTVPFIGLFVGMATLITLNRKSELVVARAAGISVWQFMAPFLIGATLIGLVTTLLINPLAAWGARQGTEIETQWRGTSGSSKLTPIPWLRQSSGDNDVALGARSVLEDGTLLVDAVLLHFDQDGRIILRQDARTAKLKDGYWV
eukprot:gene37401-42359_t